ncbi:2Fe-2S iron-sulfur cluster-binding protein [Leeia oryzae]|uniref:2Fe-2S iron-sulfur cluster-binding protein n=1 Tax=Leeia oryzae TaxID=356662 RepID=UPI00036947AC|nr:2Fe-2S iron-sulfur cluster-binding protein [Leeia oryzae]
MTRLPHTTTRLAPQKITLAQWPTEIPYRHGTLLEAILSSGVPFPHACQGGDCGQCKCKLIEGQVEMEAFSPDALTAEDAARGEILACRAYPRGPVSIAWLADDDEACFTVRYGQAKVHAIEPLGDTGYLKVELQVMGAALQFAPGQFIRVEIAGLPWRCYSLANRPGEQMLTLLVKARPDGAYTRQFARLLKPGDKVLFEGPYGEAYWRGRHDGPTLIAAVGDSMASALSILQSSLADGQTTLSFWHFGESATPLYHEHIQRLAQKHGFDYRVFAVSEYGVDGFLEAFRLLEADFEQLRVYLSGMPAVLPHMAKIALSKGVEAENIIAEPYYPAKVHFPDSWLAQLADKLSFWKRSHSK